MMNDIDQTKLLSNQYQIVSNMMSFSQGLLGNPNLPIARRVAKSLMREQLAATSDYKSAVNNKTH